MIDLTVAQIADIVGGELADISAADAAATRVTGTVEFDSRAVTPGGLFLALPGARSTATTSPRPRWPPAPSAVLAARPVGVPAIVVAPRTDGRDRYGGQRARARHRRLGRGGARRAGQAGRRGGRRAGGGRADDRRHHRLVGKDVHQGSASPRCSHRWARSSPRRAPSTTSWATRGRCCGRPRTPTTWCSRCRRAIPATSPRWPRSPRRRSAVVLNVGTAHLGEFGSREAIARTKAELPQAVPASGVVILNVDDAAVAAMAEQTAARVVRVGRARSGADVWAGPVTLDELARPRFTLHARRRRGRACDWRVHGDHQVSNALCAAAVALECGATGEQVAAALAGAGRCRGTGCRSPPAADGVTVIDDAYNANPDSMRAGLKALAWMAAGQRAPKPGAAGRCWARWPSWATTRYPSMTASAGWRCD